MTRHKPFPQEFYDNFMSKYPGMDLHVECGKWMANLEPDMAEQLEKDGHYCVAVHHMDSVQLVVDAFVGPPIHTNPAQLKEIVDRGCVGLYYNPHPVKTILETAYHG